MSARQNDTRDPIVGTWRVWVSPFGLRFGRKDVPFVVGPDVVGAWLDVLHEETIPAKDPAYEWV